MRLTFSKLICVSVFLFTLAASAEGKAWRDLVPLKSTKMDVVQILGEGIDSKSPGTQYNFANESVVVLYSGGDAQLPECARQLPPDLVLAIKVFPKGNVSLESLGLDKNKLLKISAPPDSPGTSALFDDDNGLVFSVNDGAVEVAYLPTREERDRCSSLYQDFSSFVIRRITCLACPTVSLDCPEEIVAGNKITFTARVALGVPATEPKYKWTVNEGLIIEGQGTSSITVDTSKLKGKTITATVELGEIDAACSKVASCTTQIH